MHVAIKVDIFAPALWKKKTPKFTYHIRYYVVNLQYHSYYLPSPQIVH
jgi:hypothetical protein